MNMLAYKSTISYIIVIYSGSVAKSCPVAYVLCWSCFHILKMKISKEVVCPKPVTNYCISQMTHLFSLVFSYIFSKSNKNCLFSPMKRRAAKGAHNYDEFQIPSWATFLASCLLSFLSSLSPWRSSWLPFPSIFNAKCEPSRPHSTNSASSLILGNLAVPCHALLGHDAHKNSIYIYFSERWSIGMERNFFFNYSTRISFPPSLWHCSTRSIEMDAPLLGYPCDLVSTPQSFCHWSGSLFHSRRHQPVLIFPGKDIADSLSLLAWHGNALPGGGRGVHTGCLTFMLSLVL